MPNLVLVNLLRHVRHGRQRGLVARHIALIFPEHTFPEVITQRQLRTGNPVRLFLSSLLDIRVHGSDTHGVGELLDALQHFRKSVGLGGCHINGCTGTAEIGILHPLLVVAYTDR